MGERTTHVVGIDGCPAGWVAVSARGGWFSSVAWYPDVATIVAAHRDASVFAIDIPLSFPRGAGRRGCEEEAKAFLGKFRSSLFFTPPRDVLEAESYDEANTLSKTMCGRGISRQSYALRSKIFEAVRFIEVSGETRLKEVHPEASFKLLAARRKTTIRHSKKLWSGAVDRYRLLERAGLAPPLAAPDALGKASVDDVLDAAVAAWSAQRIATGQARSFGRAEPSGSPEGLIFA